MIQPYDDLLAIVKQHDKLHGGSVTAASDGPGRGSAFIVRLPIALQPSVLPPSLLRPPADSGEPVANQGRRILIVDDNRDAAMSLALLLKRTGHETRTAPDGETALKTAECGVPK